MTTPNSLAIIAATKDSDLLLRLVAIGATLGHTQAEIEAARMKLAAAPVDSEGKTVASVFEYAAAQPRYRPGEDPSVTDKHLHYAIQATLGSE